jgi:hypothetical protein
LDPRTLPPRVFRSPQEKRCSFDREFCLRIIVWPRLWRFHVVRIPTAILLWCVPLAHVERLKPAIGWLVRVTTAARLWAMRASDDARAKRSALRRDC